MALRFRVNKADWKTLFAKGEVVIEVPKTKYWIDLIAHYLGIEDKSALALSYEDYVKPEPLKAPKNENARLGEIEVLEVNQGLATPNIIVADMYFNGETVTKMYDEVSLYRCYAIRVVKKRLITGAEQDEARAKAAQEKGKKRK